MNGGGEASNSVVQKGDDGNASSTSSMNAALSAISASVMARTRQDGGGMAIYYRWRTRNMRSINLIGS